MPKQPPRPSGPHRPPPSPPTPPRGSSKTPPPGAHNGAGRTAEVERALALRDVMQHAVRVQRETTDPRYLRQKPKTRLIVALVVCVPLLALSAYSWVARPEFIWGPNPKSVAPARRDANARMTLFLEAKRLAAYRAAQGSYPRTLDEVGRAPRGISYRRVTDSLYELRAEGVGAPLVYRSDQPLGTLLRNSVRVLNASK